MRELSSGDKIFLLHKSRVKPSEAIGFVFTKTERVLNILKRTREEEPVVLKPPVSPNIQPQSVKYSKFHEDLGEEMKCIICLDLVHQCVTVLSCLHNFCGGCLSEWLKNSEICPYCREEIKEIKKNPTISNIVEKFLETHPEKKRTKSEYEDLDKKNQLKTDRILKKNREEDRTHFPTRLSSLRQMMTSIFNPFEILPVMNSNMSLYNGFTNIFQPSTMPSFASLRPNLEFSSFSNRSFNINPPTFVPQRVPERSASLYEDTIPVNIQRVRRHYHSFHEYVEHYRQVHREEWASDKDSLDTNDFERIHGEIQDFGISFSREDHSVSNESDEPIEVSSSIEEIERPSRPTRARVSSTERSDSSGEPDVLNQGFSGRRSSEPNSVEMVNNIARNIGYHDDDDEVDDEVGDVEEDEEEKCIEDRVLSLLRDEEPEKDSWVDRSPSVEEEEEPLGREDEFAFEGSRFVERNSPELRMNRFWEAGSNYSEF